MQAHVFGQINTEFSKNCKAFVFRLKQSNARDLCSSAMLSIADWFSTFRDNVLVPSSNFKQFITDISEQPMGSIFKGQAGQICLILEDLNNRLYRNVGDYQYTLLKIPQERRSRLHPGGRLHGFLLVLRDPQFEGTTMFPLTQGQGVPFQ
jgi:hypothetical protein